MRTTLRRMTLASLVAGLVACGSNQSSDAPKDARPDSTAAKDVLAADSTMMPDAAKDGMSGPDAGAGDAGNSMDAGTDGMAMVSDAGMGDSAGVDAALDAAIPADGSKGDAVPADALPTDTSAADATPVDTLPKADTAPTVDSAPVQDSVGKTTCEYPMCLQDLQRNCVPQGACTQQFNLATFATATCYDNGVKFSTKVDLATMGSEVTWKNATSTCYTVRTANASAAGADLTWLNPAGSVVATAREDFGAMTITITCTGQSPVTISLLCGGSDGGTPSDAGVCATGVCAF